MSGNVLFFFKIIRFWRKQVIQIIQVIQRARGIYGIQEIQNTRNALNTGVQEVHGIIWNMDNGMIKGMQEKLGKQNKRQSTGTQGI